jgi:N,N'-diacetyllegionaminate synthase
MNREYIVLIGGGGHAKVVIDAVRLSGTFEIAGIIDPNLPKGSEIMGVPLLGDDDILPEVKAKGIKNAFLTVGSIGNCVLRKDLYRKLKKIGFELPRIIHPGAVIAEDVIIGEGTFAAASVTVNSGTIVGKNVILNTNASVDHDCRISDFVHIAPRVTLSGGVEIGEDTHVGVGSIVIQYKKIGKKCFIKANELVSFDMPDGEVFPYKKIDHSGFKRDKILIIAEAGVNHNGSLRRAKEMIDAAKKAGADAVKFQSFKAENIVTKQTLKAEYQKDHSGSSLYQFDMLKKLEFSGDEHKKLKTYCDKKEIIFMSSPFDLDSVDMLSDLGLDIFKIPSGEITNLPYLRKIGGLGKEIILSTGMSSMEEVAEAVNILVGSGTLLENITLLHCNTEYPSSYEDVNLKAMQTIKDTIHTSAGYSDHTSGIEVPVAAAALGAEVIEKHFTLDRNMEGPDHKASLEPDMFEHMVNCIRNVEKAIQGSGDKIPSFSELKNREVVRKSLVAAKDIKKGEVFTDSNIAAKRPGTGISPMEWDRVVGSKGKRAFKKDELIEL